MNAILASTTKVKNSMQSLKGLLPTDYPSLPVPWLVGGAAKAALNAYGKSGLASRLPIVAKLAISNVPGPPVPLLLAGARIVSFHPLSIVIHGLALTSRFRPMPAMWTRKTDVASATPSGKPPSVKRASSPKIRAIKNKATTPDASSHGTLSRPSVRTTANKTKPKAGAARRTAA
ncbi:WS/DGAT domain-containing protein [Polaromonas eurypsychrophila]|uniref:O-acyltransferase WSD1 C-terminal domain-containing protein n=1 Tax=Polaromonas eurypsychrophila TaxID=1614635 RepID=A0A916SGL5_9BURK|nr:WS/DGAT domain-containing protein [Polaromonas eurypsychrophila]GGA99878.1 hypothetical protein GCM10011496_21150 [Polaromonas eurypsychrophila]